MSFLSRFSQAPLAFEPDRGAETLAFYSDIPANAAALISGTAGCSPYLRVLLEREAVWLQQVWHGSTEEILRSIREAVEAEGFEELSTQLRQAKARTALLVALADLGGVWSLSQVTNALTGFADFAVQTALKSLVKAEILRGKLPGCTLEDLPDAAGMVVLAMGKMGAFELNYSSDIDLIVLFDETRHRPDDFEAARAGFIRITKRLCKMLSEVTRGGYVFRTDLRLRPDPSVTPVCISTEAAERYYESLGRTWERAAYIKARACAGDIKAGERFLALLRPFIWRKHLDFAAIEDAHDMRLRIRDHKGLGGPITLFGHNMKLGRGGIREIEFFTQTRQIIAGGRDAELRLRGTVESLDLLAEKGWISGETAQALSETYEEHRTIEHRLQMIADAQTHDLPSSEQQFQRLAHFCGTSDLPVFKAGIAASLELVHALTESFFTKDNGNAPLEVAELSEAAQKMVEGWRKLPALRSERAWTIFNRLRPVIFARLQRAANPHEALIQFDGFLAGLPSGVQLFSLFEANPHLIDLLVDICATAPGLAQYLSRNAQVFDAVIGGSFFADLPNLEALKQDLSQVLKPIDDYELLLNTTRRWMKERHFRIGVMLLQGLIGAEEAARGYSNLAEACLAGLFEPVCAAFSKRHGPLPGRGAMVLGMGSLGAQSLSASSDLDMIVIYDAAGEEHSTGNRPLAVSTYFARLTQALVTSLASPMAEGRLYEVDMRLRPSGRKGPVATALRGFITYQSKQAWTWEHLALTRARAVAGNTALGAEVEEFRQQLLVKKSNSPLILQEVADMRARLAEAADATRISNPWEVKLGAGRMLDIELLAQAASLMSGQGARDIVSQLRFAIDLAWCSPAEIDVLTAAYQRLQILQQVGRLLSDRPINPDDIGQGGRELLLKATGFADLEGLIALICAAQTRVDGVISNLLTRNLPTKTR